MILRIRDSNGNVQEILAIRGEDGKDGKDGADGTNGTNGTDGAKGDKGDKGDTGAAGADGDGISKIEKTFSEGNIDTYTITLTNGTTYTFTVTNGKDGKDGAVGAKGADGTDYVLTEADKQEIAEMVVSLLQNGDEVSY